MQQHAPLFYGIGIRSKYQVKFWWLKTYHRRFNVKVNDFLFLIVNEEFIDKSNIFSLICHKI